MKLADTEDQSKSKSTLTGAEQECSIKTIAQIIISSTILLFLLHQLANQFPFIPRQTAADKVKSSSLIIFASIYTSRLKICPYLNVHF